MDRGQFDALARLVSSQQSRRTAIATVLAATLLRHAPAFVLARSKRKVKAHVKPCYSGTNCTPGKGKNTSGCDFTGSTAFFQGDFRGANLSNSSFTGADLRGTDFRGANLSGACFVDVSLRDAKLGVSVNLHKAVFCNAVMPDGSLNNSGCDKGTACCPTTCQGESCAPGACNEFGDFCGTVGGSCCPEWTCINPPLSICGLYCTTTQDCIDKVGANFVCAKNQPTLCGGDLPGDVGCCSCTGDVGCVLRQ